MAHYSTIGKKLVVFENKILRLIYGSVFDIELNVWRRRKNVELREISKIPSLTSYIKCRILQWFGRVMQKAKQQVQKQRSNINRRGKVSRGRPKKRWIDKIIKYLETLNVTDWGDKI